MTLELRIDSSDLTAQFEKENHQREEDKAAHKEVERVQKEQERRFKVTDEHTRMTMQIFTELERNRLYQKQRERDRGQDFGLGL